MNLIIILVGSYLVLMVVALIFAVAICRAAAAADARQEQYERQLSPHPAPIPAETIHTIKQRSPQASSPQQTPMRSGRRAARGRPQRRWHLPHVAR